jgi:hypothetical protein
MKNVPILLDWNELIVAAECGIMRRINSLRKGRDDGCHFTADKAWSADIDACGAELGVGKYLGIYFVPLINTFKASDVAGYEVRSTALANGKLIVRPKDGGASTMLLVVTQLPRMTLIGTFPAIEARCEKFWQGDAWWVPQEFLYDLPNVG